MQQQKEWCEMKILVLSDSHASLTFMRQAIEKCKPNQVIHLGDHYDDGKTIAEQYPHILFHQVPGNCDRYRCQFGAPDVMYYPIDGVMFFMTHGHRHFVKSNIYGLIADARKHNAQIALYGHTHKADCHREEDGLWVLNPGTCGMGERTVGLIETENKEISACRILTQTEILDIAD